MLVGRVVLGNNETAARLFIEAMNDAGSLLSAMPERLVQ